MQPPIPFFEYNAAQWVQFFSAELQTSAALAGLVFVAISINLAKIVAEPFLIPRALKALITLVGILLVSSVCLVPAQPRKVLGAEIAILGVFLTISITRLQLLSVIKNPYVTTGQRVFLNILTQVAVIPAIVCGVSLIVGFGGGLYWLVVAVIFSLITAMLDAWVLLIEIHR